MGLHIMKEFLVKFPDNILHDTGLASVFEEAILPTLHFLPTITPEDESIELLSPAYQSLLLLAGKLNARVKSGPNTSQTPRARLLDRILRDGVLSAYFHAKEHVRICQLLFAVNMWLVKDMGINAVKHLKVRCSHFFFPIFFFFFLFQNTSQSSKVKKSGMYIELIQSSLPGPHTHALRGVERSIRQCGARTPAARDPIT